MTAEEKMDSLRLALCVIGVAVIILSYATWNLSNRLDALDARIEQQKLKVSSR